MIKKDKIFTIDDSTFHKYPDMDQMLMEAGIENARRREKIKRLFENQSIETVSSLYSFTLSGLTQLSIPKADATKIVRHLQILRRNSKLILSVENLREQAETLDYLSTGIRNIDSLFTYSNNKTGLRSKTVIEIYGPAGIGKTQLVMTFALQCLRAENTGWGREVLYIDTEGSFDIHRFENLALYWGVNKTAIEKNLSVAYAYSFDEVEQILVNYAAILRETDGGMIIIDSIIDPLKSQYPLDDDLSNLQRRQEHLKHVMDRLKTLAQMHNLIVIYTNQVRSAMDGTGDIVPQGGNVLSHASDIRCFLKHDENRYKKFNLDKLPEDIDFSTLQIVDCGFLPSRSTDIIYSAFGATDPSDIDRLLKSYKNSNNDPRTHLQELRDKLY